MLNVSMKSEIISNLRSKHEARCLHHRRKISRSHSANLNSDDAPSNENPSKIVSCKNVNFASDCQQQLIYPTSDDNNVISNIFDHISSVSTELNVNGDSHQLKFNSKVDDNRTHANEVTRLKELLLLNLRFIKQQNEIILARNLHVRELTDRQKKLEEKIAELKQQLDSNSRKQSIMKTFKRCENQGNKFERQNTIDKANRIKKKFCRNITSSKRKIPVKNHYMKQRKTNSTIIHKRKSRFEKADEFLTTPEEYFVNIFEEKNDQFSKEESPPVTQSEDSVVQVPTWRCNVITSCYSMEGTENLDDDIFLKRHTKFELAEKRRKRWDIQRIREQRMADKLKQRYKRNNGIPRKIDRNKANQSCEISSLINENKEVKFIDVSEKLYVNAFDHLVPFFTANEFSLPWYDENEAEKEYNKCKRNESSEPNNS